MKIFSDLKSSITKLTHLRRENQALREKIAKRGAKKKWRQQLNRNQEISRRELIRASSRIGAGATLISLIGGAAYFALSASESETESEAAQKLSQIESISKRLGGKIVYTSEKIRAYQKIAVVFPIYHTDYFQVSEEPIMVQARIMLGLARELEINTILVEAEMSGENSPDLNLRGSDEQIIRRVIEDRGDPPNRAINVILGNAGSIIGIEDRELFLRSASITLIQQAALFPEDNSTKIRILSLPDDMRLEVNRYSRGYCAELGISCRDMMSASQDRTRGKRIVIPQINQGDVDNVVLFTEQRMQHFVAERSRAFARNALSQIQNRSLSLVQLEMGVGHLLPTCDLLEKDGVGLVVVSNNGINSFVSEKISDHSGVPPYMGQ